MIVPTILIICVLQSGRVFSSEEAAKKTSIEIVEKQVLLNRIHQELWRKAWTDTEPRTPLMTGNYVDFGKISLIELLAALYERYTAIRMNLLCWRCALHYMSEKDQQLLPFLKTPDSKAAECAQMGHTLSWYNRAFMAEMYINAYNKMVSETPIQKLPEYEYYRTLKNKNNKELGALTVHQVAKKIDHVLRRLGALNDVFIEANLNYENIFETLYKNYNYLDQSDRWPIEETGEEFYAETVVRLAKFLGKDYLAVTRYMSSLIKLPGIYYTYRNLVTPLNYAKYQFKHVQKTDEIQAEYSEVEKILSFEKESFLIPLTAKNLLIPKDLSNLNLEIRPDMWDDSDYTLVLVSDENNVD